MRRFASYTALLVGGLCAFAVQAANAAGAGDEGEYFSPNAVVADEKAKTLLATCEADEVE